MSERRMTKLTRLLLIAFCLLQGTESMASCIGWQELLRAPGPLVECHWRFGFRGGLGSIYYTDRTKNLLIGQTGDNGVIATRTVPRFSDQFQQPWTVGTHIGYNHSDHTELFLDFEYTHANSKKYRYVAGSYAITDKFKPYLEWSLYTGARYYLPVKSYCGYRISPFLGAKFGITNYHRVTFKEDYTAPVAISYLSRDYYRNVTVPSIGAQVGLEYFINCAFSVNLMVEFIFSGQMNSNPLLTNADNAVQTMSIGNTGPLFSIPLTIGINYAL